MKKATFSCGRSPYRVKAEVSCIGSDILVALFGGSKPHIGSVAVALPRESLKNKDVMSATSSVYNFLGHKDGVVAQRLSETLAAKLNRKVVVVAGIHIEGITSKGIEEVVKNCDEIATKICKHVNLLKKDSD